MGLTGGLCDAGGLSDCLIGVLRKGCGDDLLDKYATIRKRIFNEVSSIYGTVLIQVTDPISQGNIERLFKLNPETAASEHELFRMMNENDDVKREILKGAMALQHGIPGVVRKRLILDFRQYYPENVAAQKAAANNAQTA